MRTKCLAAHTAHDTLYPPYLSINFDGEKVAITVRSPAKADGSCGADATIEMAPDVFRETVREAVESLA